MTSGVSLEVDDPPSPAPIRPPAPVGAAAAAHLHTSPAFSQRRAGGEGREGAGLGSSAPASSGGVSLAADRPALALG